MVAGGYGGVMEVGIVMGWGVMGMVVGCWGGSDGGRDSVGG